MSVIASEVGARVTPVVLTFNEELNIERTLKSLEWANDVVVVDSGSNDATETIARSFNNVRWFVRKFDTHGQQWDFAIRGTGAKTPHLLALDADYEVPSPFVDELGKDFVSDSYAGGIAAFEYRIRGRALMGSVYPAKLVLFRRDDVRVTQPGHTQEFEIAGPIYRFKTRLIHDDRKSPDRFFQAQLKYSQLEASKLLNGSGYRWQDRVRRLGLMPVLAGPAAYVRAGGPLRGLAAVRYAYERTLFETLLALRLLGIDPEQHAPSGQERSRPPRQQ
jgi:glycosyltransferase involved in cell wall biosynthesis